MRVILVNVNGIRAAHRKNFFTWLQKENPDIVCVQETKAQVDQLVEEILKPNISLFSSSGASLATNVSGSGANWTATYTLNSSEDDGLSTFNIDLSIKNFLT